MPTRRNISLLRRPLLLLGFVAALSGAETLAQSAAAFGPERFALSNGNKAKFTRTFAASDTSRPYTLTVTNGSGDGSSRIVKGKITLNGRPLLDKSIVNRRAGRVVVAVRLEQQNEIRVQLKGGGSGSFLNLSIEPTLSTLINNPGDPHFDAAQEGVGYPFSVVVDQSTHRAYVADRVYDAVHEFEVAQTRVSRRFMGLDGDALPSNGSTSSVSFNPNSRTVFALNPGESLTPGGAAPPGTLALISPDSGDVRVTQLSDPEGDIHPFAVAVNPGNNVAAFNALYSDRSRRAYFLDLPSGVIATRDEDAVLTSVANNPSTGEFVFAGSDGAQAPSLIIYSSAAPFERVRRINSTARAGTEFEKVAINPATNIAVAVNQRDAAVFVFDLAAGSEVARIPITVGTVEYTKAEVAINPETNQAVVISRYTNLVSVIDLSNGLLMAEIPLPEAVRPLAVGIDHALNRAVIAENGFGGSTHNGSILVIQLPTP